MLQHTRTDVAVCFGLGVRRREVVLDWHSRHRGCRILLSPAAQPTNHKHFLHFSRLHIATLFTPLRPFSVMTIKQTQCVHPDWSGTCRPWILQSARPLLRNRIFLGQKCFCPLSTSSFDCVVSARVPASTPQWDPRSSEDRPKILEWCQGGEQTVLDWSKRRVKRCRTHKWGAHGTLQTYHSRRCIAVAAYPSTAVTAESLYKTFLLPCHRFVPVPVFRRLPRVCCFDQELCSVSFHIKR